MGVSLGWVMGECNYLQPTILEVGYNKFDQIQSAIIVIIATWNSDL